MPTAVPTAAPPRVPKKGNADPAIAPAAIDAADPLRGPAVPMVRVYVPLDPATLEDLRRRGEPGRIGDHSLLERLTAAEIVESDAGNEAHGPCPHGQPGRNRRQIAALRDRGGEIVGGCFRLSEHAPHLVVRGTRREVEHRLHRPRRTFETHGGSSRQPFDAFAQFGWLAVCGVAMTATLVALLVHLSGGRTEPKLNGGQSRIK